MTEISNNAELQQSCITAVNRSYFSSCYRIVSDNHSGYEVQIKRWFFPFCFFQKHKYGVINTFSNMEEAKQWINNGCKKDKIIKPKPVVLWCNCG
jgi:hypothetical protein